MSIEPWKLMLGMSGLLVVFGILVVLDVSLTSPGELIPTLLFIGLILVMTYVGYKIGRKFEFGSKK